MYRTSKDLRFVKNREAMQRAFVELVLEKRSANITVKELAERARVNRMTFYAHYDAVEDILREFIDEIAAELLECQAERERFDLSEMIMLASEYMERDIEFFRLVAQEDGFESYRYRFRDAFKQVFSEGLQGSAANADSVEAKIALDMIASGVTYAYLDWLSGEYGDLAEAEFIALIDRFVQSFVAGAIEKKTLS